MSADRSPLSPRTIVATVAVAVLVAALVFVVNAPANWLARDVARRTHGVVLLADAQGTIWAGSAVVAIGAATEPETAIDRRDRPVERLALPGRVMWTLEWAHPLAPVLHLTHDGVLLQPLAVRYADGGLAFDAGAAALPASLLRLVGAPLNTLAPDGRCELRWNALRIDPQGMPIGDGTLRVGDFTLAISAVKPLGDYRVTWTSSAQGLVWQLATERGPLALDGDGSFAGARSRVHVVVRAAADAPVAVVAQLGPLFDMIGRRGPNEAVIDSAS